MADVIVVGAGVAGLAAAVALTRASVDVLVIEARAHVGGRILTKHAAGGAAVELGAEFVHGQAEAVRRHADAARLLLEDSHGSHWWKRGRALEPIPHFGDQLERVMKTASRSVRQGRDRSFADSAERTHTAPRPRALAESFVEGFDAAPGNDISMRALTAGSGGADTMARVLGGYGRLVDYLASRLPPGTLRLASIVEHVRWTPGDVRVTVRRALEASPLRLRARRLVTTLPLAVLHAGDVSFDPPLAAKSAVLGRLATGDVVRVTFQFRRAPWRDCPAIPSRHREAARRLSFLHAPGASDSHVVDAVPDRGAASHGLGGRAERDPPARSGRDADRRRRARFARAAASPSASHARRRSRGLVLPRLARGSIRAGGVQLPARRGRARRPGACQVSARDALLRRRSDGCLA